MWENMYSFVVVPILIFAGGYIYLRIAGKKAVSEMNSFDLLFIVVMGTIVAEPLVNKEVWRALLYGASFMALYILFSWASLNNQLRWILLASPTVLIRNGDIDEKGLRKVRMTVGQLLSELRIKGYTKTGDIELAMMEDMGQLSVIPKSNVRPVQPSDLNILPKPEFISIPVVMDGQIIDHNLKFIKKDRDWLNLQLKVQGLSTEKIDKVTLATVNQQGTLEIDNNNPHDNDKGAFSYKPGRDN